MPEHDVEVLMAASRQDTEAARQISYWSKQLQAAQEARTQLAALPPAIVMEALRQRR